MNRIYATATRIYRRIRPSKPPPALELTATFDVETFKAAIDRQLAAILEAAPPLDPVWNPTDGAYPYITRLYQEGGAQAIDPDRLRHLIERSEFFTPMPKPPVDWRFEPFPPGYFLKLLSDPFQWGTPRIVPDDLHTARNEIRIEWDDLNDRVTVWDSPPLVYDFIDLPSIFNPAIYWAGPGILNDETPNADTAEQATLMCHRPAFEACICDLEPHDGPCRCRCGGQWEVVDGRFRIRCWPHLDVDTGMLLPGVEAFIPAGQLYATDLDIDGGEVK